MRLKKMQMITVHVTHTEGIKALQSLQAKGHIKIIDNAEVNSPALPGPALSLKEFKEWIAEAEKSPTISQKEAKKQWAAQRKLLLKLTQYDVPIKPSKK